MVRCDDTGAYYAWQANIYYDTPDEEDHVCEECGWFDACPCRDVGWGMCSYWGEWRQCDTDACEHYTEEEQ